MATIAQNQDEENPQNPAGGPTTVAGTGGAGGSGTGVAAAGAGTGPAASPVQQAPNPQNSSGYTDVASYLNANQGGASKLGSQVSTNLTNNYNDTKAGIDNSYNSFTGQVNSGYVPENTDLINQVTADPTAAASDSTLSSGYQAQLNDTYTGPTQWDDFGTQQGNVNNATQYGSLPTTPGGLNVLTQQVEGQNGGPQSQGINQLDTLILGGSPTAMSQVQAAADPYSGLNDYINTQNTAGTQAIGQAQTAATKTAADALGAFTGANGTLTNLDNTINTNATNAQNTATAQNASVLADLKNLYGGAPVDSSTTQLGTYNGGTTPWYNTTNYNVGDISPQDLQTLGMTQDQWNALKTPLQGAATSTMSTGAGTGGHNFGAGSPTSQVDLTQWLTQQDPTQAITAANTATPQQYAEMQAIQSLLGSKTPQGSAINPALASLAGTAPTSTNQFNYNNALTGAQGLNYDETQAAIAEANSLNSGADQSHAEAQHGGGFLNGLVQDVTHPLSTAASLVNPAAWVGNAENIVNGKGVSPTNINPVKPTDKNTATPLVKPLTPKSDIEKYLLGLGTGGAAGAGTSA